MSTIIDQIPWWIYPLLFSGGGVLIIAFVPGALAFVIGVWNMMPKWAKWTLIICGGFVFVYFKGRNVGNANAKAEQQRLAREAVQTRERIHEDVRQRTPDRIDRDLDKWLRDK